MDNTERFNLPVPPQGLAFPDPAQLYITVVMWIVVAGFVAYSLYLGWKTRNPMAPLLLVGGAICYFTEPMVDLLLLCWHPRVNQWVVLETFGPVPAWGLGIYIIFFGAMTYLMLHAAQRGFSRKAFWIGVSAFFVANLLCELPIIHYGLYTYYNDPPYSIFGFPLYWLFVNAIGPLYAVALLFKAPQFFSGWRQVLILLLPMTTDIAGSVSSGWPIMSALNTPGASSELKWFAATLTIVLGLIIMDGVSRLICSNESRAVPRV